MVLENEVFLREAYLIHPLNFHSLCCMSALLRFCPSRASDCVYHFSAEGEIACATRSDLDSLLLPSTIPALEQR